MQFVFMCSIILNIWKHLWTYKVFIFCKWSNHIFVAHLKNMCVCVFFSIRSPQEIWEYYRNIKFRHTNFASYIAIFGILANQKTIIENKIANPLHQDFCIIFANQLLVWLLNPATHGFYFFSVYDVFQHQCKNLGLIKRKVILIFCTLIYVFSHPLNSLSYCIYFGMWINLSCSCLCKIINLRIVLTVICIYQRSIGYPFESFMSCLDLMYDHG